MKKPALPAHPAVLLLFAFATAAQAQWSHRVDLDLLATSFDTQAGAPTVAADGAGGVFAAWDDNRDVALTGTNVFIQRYDADGIAKWTTDGVPVVTAVGRQDDPLVVPVGGGSVVVLWLDERVANDPRIHAQRFDGLGVAQWTANGVRVGVNDFDQSRLAVAGDPAGDVFVTWAETTNNFRTFVQKLDANGAPLWGANGVEYSSGVFGGGSVINVIADGNGGAVVGWIQFGANPRTVWMQRILANGAPAFAPVGFGNDTTALGNLIAMAPDGTGGAILGWQADNGVNDNLHLQRVDGAGTLPWGAGSVPLVNQPNVQDNLHLVTDGAGGAFCVWDDPRTGVDDTRVQRITAAGTFAFAADGIPAGVLAGQRFTARALADGAGGVIVTFRFNQEGTFAQRIDASGARLWGDNGVALTDNASVNFPNLTSDGAGGAVLGVLAFKGGNRPALKRVLAGGRLPGSRLVNISTRAFVGTGDALAIPGFVIGGSGTRTLLVRAIGPALLPFGVPDRLADPTLTVFNALNQPIASRDDWGEGGDATLVSTTAATVGAFAIPPGGKDSAIVLTLPATRHTAGISGVGGTTGIALVEVYDAGGPGGTSFIANLSSRVFVGTGDAVAIPGFVFEGPATMTLLLRAVGPTLNTEFGLGGVLADPILTLFNSLNVAIATNDNWSAGGSTQTNLIAAAAQGAGAFPLAVGTLDATLLLTLPPGRYTAGVTGAGGGTGLALVEVYVVP